MEAEPFGRPMKRVVVKIGSAVLAGDGVLDPRCLRRIAADIGGWLSGTDHRRAVIVTSGAVASGFRSLGLARPPRKITDKQAAAAVGQPLLMAEWSAAFARLKPPRVAAQVLLTADDIDHRARFLNARHTLERLLEAGVVPIVNENDSVSYAEIKLGDNDRLSALVASLIGADMLMILSSVPGVLASGTGAGVIPEIRSLKEGLAHVRTVPVGGKGVAVGTGGMATKLTAACEAASLGTSVVIADGAEERIVQRVLAGERLGTRFPPAGGAARSRAAREKWIGFAARPKGLLRVDAGARSAVQERGASLLPSGLVAVEGQFPAGSLVELIGPDGPPFARGLSSYSSADADRIRGLKASEIEGRLGYRYADEIVRRDDLVLIRQERE